MVTPSKAKSKESLSSSEDALHNFEINSNVNVNMLPNHGYTSGFTDVTKKKPAEPRRSTQSKRSKAHNKEIDEDSQILEEAMNYRTKGSRDSKENRS